MKRIRWLAAIALAALAALFLFGSPHTRVSAQGVSIDDAHNILTVTGADEGESVLIRSKLSNVSAVNYPSAVTGVFFDEVGGDIALSDLALSLWAGASGWQPAGATFKPTQYPGYDMELDISGFSLPPGFTDTGTWIRAVANRNLNTVKIKVITYVDLNNDEQYELNEGIISEIGGNIDHNIQIDLLGLNLETVYVDDDWAGCDPVDPEVDTGKFCQINAFATIQEAIDAARPGGTVDVYPGTYDQDEANGRNPDTGGAGSNDFNIFVGKPLTLEGVDASGDPIADYDDVAAFVEAERQLPTFGASTIFVQADGVTITGLDITGWQVDDYWDNKTLEVVGDNFTLKDCAVHALDTVSTLYFDDRHFNAGTMTSHVRSYHVLENLLDGGGPDADGIRISSGAGWSGPVSGRVIADNTIDSTIDGIAFVGPGGDPWDVYPVGAATITGNSFSSSDRRHVVAWGSYEGGPGYGDIDWQGIVENNSFDKAAITWTPGGDAQPWSAGSFVDVRGIYSAIQRYAINKAQDGDTIQVLPGLYPETLNIEGFSDLSIVGDDRDTVIVKPASTLPWNVGGYGTSRQAAVRVVSSTGIDLSNMTFDFDLVKGNNVAGLLYWDSSGVISGNALKNMTASDASGFYGELTSYVRAPSYSDGARAEVQFSGNVFTETGRLGIVTHDFVHATIQGNTFTKTINDFGYAMEIGSRSTATVTGNTISGYDTPAASDGSSSAGIYIENSFTGGLPHIVKPVTVSDNEVTGNQYGVWIGNEYAGYAGDIDVNVTLQGNTISDNTDGGLYIVDEGRSAGSSVTVNASGNDVTNNGDVGYWFNAYGDGELHANVSGETISGQGDGVRIDNTSGGNNLFDLHIGPNNEIFDNDNGIAGLSVSGIVISGNTIHNNVNRSGSAGVGIMFWGDSDNEQILNNVVYENDRQGIFLGHDTEISTGSTISGNTVYDNGRNTHPNPPDASAYGIQLWNADDNVIAYNEVYGHDDWLPYPPPSTFDFAQGIYLFDSNGNTLTGNNLHDNNYGVGVWGPGRGDGSNLINLNIIAGNTGFGVRSFDSAFEVDATNNWWGHVTGPYHATKNPAGLGDDVSNYVLFDPWLTLGDQDMDGVSDTVDNCPTVANPDQLNSDSARRPNGSVVLGNWASNPAQDKLGDACDPDNDNDALPDAAENESTCPFRLVADSDGDRVLDGYEVANGYDPCSAASKPPWEGGSDSDGDRFTDWTERSGYNTCAFAGDTRPGYSTCASPTDSDGDACADWIEIVDVNGDRIANILDVVWVARRAFNVSPFVSGVPTDSDAVLDIDRNGTNNILDVTLAAKNSTLLSPHSPCASEG